MTMLPGAKKDAPSVTSTGEVLRAAIDGVSWRESRPIVTRNGTTYEAFRHDWYEGGATVEQLIVATLRPNAVSAWHCHQKQTDRLAVLHGAIRLVLFDGRDGSATRGALQVHLLSPVRPTLVVIPPGVWHGLQNLEASASMFMTLFDRAYRHDDPDEWRLPPDTDAIPHRF